jgi:hypothetical protein
MSPQRRAEVAIELDAVTREASRLAESSDFGVKSAGDRQLSVLRQVAKVLHIELAVAGK